MASSHTPAGSTPQDEFKLSGDEMKGFEKAFKDPEFVKMFGEYAQEINDPANKAETEMYLRQLERQGEIESVYGKGTQLIVPTPEFVFKTKDKGDGLKVFVNMCSSDKVGKPELRAAQGSKDAAGQHLNLPLAGSNARREALDKNGNKSWVYDITMHPEAFQMLHKHPKMLQAMVESAIEHIEKANNVKLDHKFSRPKLSFKGTPGHEQKPAVTAIRGEGTSSVSGNIKPQSRAPSSAGKLVPELASPGQHPADPPASQRRPKRSPFAPRFSNGTAPKTSRDPGFQHTTGEVTPQYTIVHQGNRDLTEAWNDPTGRPCKGVPKALVIRITLPGLISAASVELDVAATKVTAVVPGKYRLELLLPFCITDDGSANFNRDSGVLTLILPVAGLKAGSSTAPAVLSSEPTQPHHEPDRSSHESLLEPSQVGCEGAVPAEGHSVGARPSLVQVLSDIPETNGVTEGDNQTDQASHEDSASQLEVDPPEGVGPGTDGSNAAAMGTVEEEKLERCCGGDDAGVMPAAAPGDVYADNIIVGPQDRDNGQKGQDVNVEGDHATTENEFRPVPLSQRAPAVCSQQPSHVAQTGAECCYQEHSEGIETVDGAVAVSCSGGRSGEGGPEEQVQPTQVDPAEVADVAMQSVQAARSGDVPSDQIDLKALAAAWSVANASLDSKLSEGTKSLGDQDSLAGREQAGDGSVQDVQVEAAEPEDAGNKVAEIGSSSAQDTQAVEQQGPIGSAQQAVRGSLDPCVKPADACQEVSRTLQGVQAGSLPLGAQTQEQGSNQHKHSVDPYMHASVSHAKVLEQPPTVKLEMALDLPMLDELD